MKSQSLKTIQTVINLLNAETDKTARELLLNVVRLETSQSATPKFNIFKFTAKDKIRPAMTGVFHCEGFKVASDAHVLIVEKEDYDAELEGKIMGKDGSIIEGKYPNYKAIYTSEGENVKISFDKLEDAYNRLKTLKKAKIDLNGEQYCYLTFGEGKRVFVDLEKMFLLASFMKHIGTDEVRVRDERKSITVHSGENWGVIMPNIIDDKRNSVCISE